MWKYFDSIDKDGREKNGWAIISEEYAHEFMALETNAERAAWLDANRDVAKITRNGEQFIEENTRE